MSAYASYTDEQLMRLIQNNEEGAFTALYNRYWQRLFYVAGTRLNDLSLAREIVQDIFTDLWERRAAIDIKGAVKAYLNVALKYQVINQQAKRKRARDFELYAIAHNTDADYSTEQQLSFDELKERLAVLVTELPEKCRLVFRLSREEGLSHKEIAGQLNISEKTIESHLSKALRHLRGGLSELFSFLLSLALFFLG